MGKKDWNLAYAYLKGLDPSSNVNFNKLDKKLQSKIKKILGSKKRGYNGENFDSNRANFTLAGISKLKNKLNSSPSGHSKEYEKAKKIAEVEAKRITEELENQFVAKILQKSKNQKIKERQKRNRKREIKELQKMNNKNQNSASTFIQSVQSNQYNKEELMKNFCKIHNQRIQDNIVVSLFIQKFNANIEEIHESLESENKLEVLSKNFYELEVHYKQIFIRFHELQSKFLSDPSFQNNLEKLLKNIELKEELLKELIDEINKNGFNLELVIKLQDWIEQFKKMGSEKYNLNIESLQEKFVLKEQKSEIEPILEKILLRKQLLKIQEELIKDNFESIMRKIALYHHQDKIIFNIEQLKNILKGNGSPNNFFQKYEIGYFTAKEFEMVRTLVDELIKNIESLKEKYEEDLKRLDSKKEEEESLLDKIQNKNEEIIGKKREVENKFKQLINDLKINFANAQDELFNKLGESLSDIHKTATQRFNEDSEILKRYFDLQKKMEQEGGVKKNELSLVKKSKDHTSIFENSYINFFYPIEFLLTEYKKIITNYNELFTEVLNIKDKLYFYMKIYNRLKSKDITTYSCTFAYIAFQILNIESNTVDENDYIEAFRDYCKETSFPDDISANASLKFLKQSIPALTGSQEELKLLLPGTSSNIINPSNKQSLVTYSEQAAKKRQANKNRLNAKQKERKENEKRRKMEKISNLLKRIKNTNSSNRELTLKELRQIKAMKEGLNKELEGLNSQHEIQNYLTQLNINKRISNEQRRLRELEIVGILNAANKLPNDTPITDVKKTLDKLIKIKENNSVILTESNNQIIDELIKRLIEQRIALLEKPNLKNVISSNGPIKEKVKKIKAPQQRGEKKEWYSKIDNIVFISKENTNKIRKEKMIEKRVDKAKIEKYKSKFLKLIIAISNEDGNVNQVYINDTVKDFINKIALPLWNKLNKKQLKFMKNKAPQQEEIDRLKIELQNIFMNCINDKEKITISNLFFRFFNSFDKYSIYKGSLKLSFNRESNNNDKQNLDFVISLAK